MTVVKAYLKRMIWESRQSMKSYMMSIIAILLFINIISIISPELFTPQTMSSLQALAYTYIGEESQRAISLAFLFLMQPFLVILLVSLLTSSYASSIIPIDKRNGVFEVILSSPNSTRNLNLSLILSSLFISAIAVIIIIPLSIITSYAESLYLGISISNELWIYYLKILAITPLVVVLSTLLSILIGLLIPNFSTLRTGLTPLNTLGGTLGSLPALIAFLWVNIYPNDLLLFTLYFSIASAILLGVILLIMPKIINTEKLISSD